MSKIQDLRKKSDAELATTVQDARKTVQDERFKDAFSRKAHIIRTSKKDIARSLTELQARRRNNDTK
jgi:ribosomal protein L29